MLMRWTDNSVNSTPLRELDNTTKLLTGRAQEMFRGDASFQWFFGMLYPVIVLLLIASFYYPIIHIRIQREDSLVEADSFSALACGSKHENNTSRAKTTNNTSPTKKFLFRGGCIDLEWPSEALVLALHSRLQSSGPKWAFRHHVIIVFEMVNCFNVAVSCCCYE